jgi:hypothetical protein
MTVERERIHIRNLPSALYAMARRLWGLGWIYLWVNRTRVKWYLDRGAVGFLAFSLILLFLEVMLEVIHTLPEFQDFLIRALFAAATIYGYVDLALGIFATAPKWGGMADNASRYLQAVYLSAIAGATYFKIREWKERGQEFRFIQAAREIVATLRVAGGHESRIERVLPIFAFTFGNGGISVSVAPIGADSKLVVRHQCGPAQYDPNLKLALGEGGAGLCCREHCAVYFPRKSLGHAILQDITEGDYDLEMDLFVRDDREPFESVLSVPMVANGYCYGAVSFDSPERDAFKRLDREQALFFGYVVAQVLREAGSGYCHEVGKVTIITAKAALQAHP